MEELEMRLAQLTCDFSATDYTLDNVPKYNLQNNFDMFGLNC